VGPVTRVALVLPVRDDRFLAGLRIGDAAFDGCWEFPGGKINPGENPEQAAVRELMEETGLSASDLEPLCTFPHRYADRDLKLHCYLARKWSGPLKDDPTRNWTWFTLAELEQMTMPQANRRILKELAVDPDRE